MHIPDGFLDMKTAATMGVISAVGLGVALRQTRLNLPPRRVPLMGLAGAFIFAAQMLNFPVLGGTSGHMVGGVLAAVLLGPSAAFIVISAVLIVQATVFGDGGISALGANIFNMGLISAIGGWCVYMVVYKALLKTSLLGRGRVEQTFPEVRDRTLPNDAPAALKNEDRATRSTEVMGVAELRAKLVAAAFASWLIVVIAAVACAGELALSGTIRWSIVFPAMTQVHMLIGIGEGLITVLVLLAIAKSRPELLRQDDAHSRGRYGALVIYGLLVSLGLALFVSPFASKWPDGLDRAAEVLGFKDRETAKPIMHALLPDYKMPGIPSATIATSIAGAGGTAVVFGLAMLLARVLVPEPKPEKELEAAGH